MAVRNGNLSAGLLLPSDGPEPRHFTAFLPDAAALYWVAADGGYDMAQNYDLAIAAIIGDFDSLQDSRTLVPQLRFPAAKDASDRNLALEHLAYHGHRNIVQVGGGGGRSDHFLAMIYDYQQPLPRLPKLWLTRHEAIFYLEEGEQFQLSTAACGEALISSFPLESHSKLESRGLKWPLQNMRLPYSLSNWITEPKVSIAVTRGRALVFFPYRGQFQQIGLVQKTDSN